MAFAPVVERESYRMRSSAQYKGDRVERRVRLINGTRYDFTRVTWGDGSVTVTASVDGRMPFREWTKCGMWTDPEYLGR